MDTLEARLQAMRLANLAQLKIEGAGAAEKEDTAPTAMIRSRLNCLHEPRQQFSAPPLSRQRSLEAIANFASGNIRTLEIPAGIITQFIMLAAPNTNRPPYGIETCGILAGILPCLTDIFHSPRSKYDQKLIITTLIIPKQETHPKQNFFLSSVDVHTQCGFQSILPEAVAIVVEPNDLQKTPAAKINVDNGQIPTKIAESF
ncbi:hypothetical protein PsorP6_005354 [Peronosclerospora sorghi]|uniref:Uncharacterized protein n=1 Tax=Peronosclerospora sorghi TaxID=230839 RepID=A0ACC0W309_9STRA|nr:hypothetical protein PsorP6_005354 [Peronosclerospora sorghi]